MDTRDLTPPVVAKQLGVSLPTVHRGLDGLGVKRAGKGIQRPVSPEKYKALRDRIGATPILVDGLDRTATLVLAAVANAGLGLESDRAVSRAAGTSPSGTGKALRELARRGLVTRSSRRVVRGGPINVDLWKANLTSKAWSNQISRALKSVAPPSEPKGESTPPVRVPKRFHHLFWNADLTTLNVRDSGSYVAHRMLDQGDLDAWVWTIESLPESDLRKSLKVRGLDRRAARFVWNSLAAKEGS